MKFRPSKPTFVTAVILIGALLLTACVSTTNNKTSPDEPSKVTAKTTTFSPRAENQYLSQEQAFKRSARVSNVSYQLHYNLTGAEHFSASSTINFTLSDNA